MIATGEIVDLAEGIIVSYLNVICLHSRYYTKFLDPQMVFAIAVAIFTLTVFILIYAMFNTDSKELDSTLTKLEPNISTMPMSGQEYLETPLERSNLSKRRIADQFSL